MSNLSRLMDAGLIAGNATFTPAEQQILDSLSDDEVSALISVQQKIPADFLQKHCGVQSTQPVPATRTIGIVF